jgi:hypothetical protein
MSKKQADLSTGQEPRRAPIGFGLMACSDCWSEVSSEMAEHD